MATQTEVSDYYTRHHVQLQRFIASAQSEATKALAKIDTRIARVILAMPANPTKRQIDKAVREISTIVQNDYPRLAAKMEQLNRRYVFVESKFQKQGLIEFTPIGTAVAGVPVGRIMAKAARETYQGKTINRWWKELARDTATRARRTLRKGIVEGKSSSQIVSDLKFIQGAPRHNVETLVRSTIQHSANVTRDMIFQANDDLIDGTVWISTLDGRTTIDICAPRDAQHYDKDRNPIDGGDQLPYDAGPGAIHFNCRSTEAPLIKGVEASGMRPSVGPGKGYERGGMTTQRGTVRRRGGNLEPKRVGRNTTYEEWLARQPKAFQQDVLGVKRAEVFRETGRLKNVTYFGGQSNQYSKFGQPLSVKQLEERI